MKVVFHDSMDQKRVLGEATNKKDAWKIIKDFLDEHNFKSYYTRVEPHVDEHYVWLDVGSHTEFFLVTEMTDEEMKEWMI